MLYAKNGWRGSGYVRWEHPTNRAFLECLSGLQKASEQIGDFAESERCTIFLLQLEPNGRESLAVENNQMTQVEIFRDSFKWW